MAFQFSAAAFAACIAIVMVALDAHEGHDHSHMAPSSPPMSSANWGALSSFPSAVVGFLALVVSFIGVFGTRV
ncbi:Hypothetical predicted protein [Olea europaea subsp. europaea]|uniref:Uncharacterized protein n=1 Tax=Olea europaea subsp. europaea TaxID=158383 RepID=A0A8S0QVS9_OLEEU|nr:Hypothetical predicted protein [Olea europaea subsp. europaea]